MSTATAPLKRTCATCCFSSPLPYDQCGQGRKQKFLCRYRPPEPGMGFPVVTADDWCGKGQTLTHGAVGLKGPGLPHPAPVGYLVADILRDYDDVDFVLFIETLAELRCLHCGVHTSGHRCHCQNDE